MENIVNKLTYSGSQTIGLTPSKLTKDYGIRIGFRAHQDNTGVIYIAMSSDHANADDCFIPLGAEQTIEFDMIDLDAFDFYASASLAAQKLIVYTYTREL